MAAGGAEAALVGAQVGMGIIGGMSKSDAMKQVAQVNAANQMLKLQATKTQEAERLNRTMSSNLVTGSTTGLSLSSPSILAMNTDDFDNYDRDQKMYDIDGRMIQANEQAQMSSANSAFLNSFFGGASRGMSTGMSLWGAGSM